MAPNGIDIDIYSLRVFPGQFQLINANNQSFTFPTFELLMETFLTQTNQLEIYLKDNPSLINIGQNLNIHTDISLISNNTNSKFGLNFIGNGKFYIDSNASLTLRNLQIHAGNTNSDMFTLKNAVNFLIEVLLKR